MSKKDRLTTADFRKLRPGRRFHGALVTLSVASLEKGPARYSCVVSKKVSPLATTRNRIKRRLRNAVVAAGIPRQPLALVFTAKKSSVDAAYRDIIADVSSVLRNIRS